ncbi:MAG: helix-turn-helix transcriptional regulator [Eubacteriales bacterium]|nr:helix-turn-helix transcriptional regulator [Eubacteriales bacterium]
MRKYKRIRELREEKNLSQSEIAEKFHISQRTYSRYENSGSTIPLDILIRIADLHDVSVDYLLERTDVRPIRDRRKPR